MAVVQALPEVSEEEADPRLKHLFMDIQHTLRSPVINRVFRVLATCPDYLISAWVDLKPNVQTVYFEQQADEIRRRAVEIMGSAGQAPSPPNKEEITNVLRVFHYIDPKVMLVVAALRSAVTGQYPQLRELTVDEKRQIQPGIPQDAPEISVSSRLDERATGVIEDINATFNQPATGLVYQALAPWPHYLEEAWQSLKAVIHRPDYHEIQRDIRRMADEAVLAFPYRMDINPHVLRHSGLSERDIDWVRNTLSTFYAAYPRLNAHIAFWMAGLEGREAASRSPFPVPVM